MRAHPVSERCRRPAPSRSPVALHATGSTGSDFCRHVGELPANLIFDGFWPVKGQPSRRLGSI